MNETVRLILIFIAVAIIVVLIANIELYINKQKAIYSSSLVKRYEMLTPRKTGLQDPIWIFNTKNVHAKDIQFPHGFNKNKFTKSRIQEHLASKLNRPISDLFTYLKHLPKSTMPINTLYNTISKGEEAVFNVDPGSGTAETNYKIIHSKRDNIETFISGDQYFILAKVDNDKESPNNLMKN